MNQLGVTLSGMVGAHKTAEVTPTGAQRSATTNSYNKRLEQLVPAFPAAIIAAAQKVVDKYDRASFDEKVDIEDVFLARRRRVHNGRRPRIRTTNVWNK